VSASTASIATRSTCARPGPRRDHSISFSTTDVSPCTTASTVPSLRLRAHPVIPSWLACCRMDSRKKTPWTWPWMRRWRVIFKGREYRECRECREFENRRAKPPLRYSRHLRFLRPFRPHFTFIPGCAPLSGDNRKIPAPSPLAASTMPWDSPKRILRGCRFATMTVRRPTSVAGS
jgi:hypothetical protein